MNRFIRISNAVRLLPFLALCAVLAEMISCDCGTEPPPINDGPDTTSHDFMWKIDTLGDGNSSVLYDVFVINDSNIWAVGALYLRDTVTGQIDPEAYNLARWNGSGWNLSKVSVPICGTSFAGSFPLYAVFAFGPNDVWITGGGEMGHWNGSMFSWDCSMSTLIDGAITKIWGSSATNLYAVGERGTIVHCEGTVWQKLESGTTFDLQDVWGAPDGSLVWTCTYSLSQSGTYLSAIQNNLVTRVYDGTQNEFIIRDDTISGKIVSLFTDAIATIDVLASAGIYRCPSGTRGEGRRLSFVDAWFPGFPHRVRGNRSNDFFVVGDEMLLAHFNGMTWRHYSEYRNVNNLFYAVSHKDDLVAAVGVMYDPIYARGLVMTGRR